MVKKANRKTRKSLDQTSTGQKSIGRIGKFVLGLFIFLSVSFILFMGWFSGVIPWTQKYISCGKPPVVVTSSIAGANPQRLHSGDYEYGPGFFNTYECP